MRKICFFTGTRAENGVITPLMRGEIFTKENIGIKRPGNGISPMRLYEIIGTFAMRDIKEDEII